MTRTDRLTLPHWSLGLLMLALAGTPLSSKAAGAAWLGLCLAGLWLAVRRAPAPSPGVRRAAVVWCITSGLGLVFAVIGTWIWHDPWDELHAPIRLALAGAAGMMLAGRAGTTAGRAWLGHGLAAACVAACVLAVIAGQQRAFPTNAIAWAVSIGFLVCLLVPLALDEDVGPRDRIVWGVAVLAGITAVVLSQSRGAYGVVLWVLVCCITRAWSLRSRDAHAGRAARFVLGALFTMVVIATPFMAPVVNRISEAANQFEAVTDGDAISTQDANSSVGARILLWELAVKGFAESPLTGVGREERLRRIQEAGRNLKSRHMTALGHVHSEYLHAAFDHGLPGLASVLFIVLGLGWAALRIGPQDPAAAWQLAGLAFMHGSAGLTNVNTAHNYYGAMLALTTLLVLLTARARAPITPA